jgi:GntR family transcriptional repressor for pyruvate dehydrogenase complex
MSDGAEKNPLVALREIATKNIADKLAERLCEMILEGKLPSGYVFPSENALSEELQVGRSTIREAYNVLKTRGLITRTKRGTFVNVEEDIIANMPFEDMVERSNEEEYFEFYKIIFVNAAALAAERAADDDVDILFESLEKLRQVDNFVEEFLILLSSFHLRVIDAANNTLLRKSMIVLSEPFIKRMSQICNMRKKDMQQIINSHETIINAIKQKDIGRTSDSACNALKELNKYLDSC